MGWVASSNPSTGAIQRGPRRSSGGLFIPEPCFDRAPGVASLPGSKGEDGMRLRSIFVYVATVGLMVGPALVHGVMGSVAGAAKDCTIVGTAANDDLTGTTKADVICTKAG